MSKWLCFSLSLVSVLLIAGCKRNQPPSILAIKAFPDQISAGDTTDLLVSVTDPDNDPLTYKWQAKDGDLSSKKDSLVRWTAPDKPGKYKITVTVTDKSKGSDTKTLELQVAPATKVYSGSLGGGESTSPRRARAEKAKSSRKSSSKDDAEPSTKKRTKTKTSSPR